MNFNRIVRQAKSELFGFLGEDNSYTTNYEVLNLRRALLRRRSIIHVIIRTISTIPAEIFSGAHKKCTL